MEKIDIKTGIELFRFETFDNWVNTAQYKYAGLGLNNPTQETIAINKNGEICTRGKHFIDAKTKYLFPVIVYANRQDESKFFTKDN